MSDPSRALQNLNGAARLVAEAAANLRTIADKATLRRLRLIQVELKLIEEQQRGKLTSARVADNPPSSVTGKATDNAARATKRGDERDATRSHDGSTVRGQKETARPGESNKSAAGTVLPPPQ